jgi:uncharacterized OsmC-like protein
METMETMDRIRSAFSRLVHVYTKRPEVARYHNVMRARIIEGLACEAREGDWRAVIDMPVEVGGSNQGPTPGVHGRAALASCLAIGYAINLARAGIAVRAIEVQVEADIDYRGLAGFADVNPGYSAVRHTLYLDCDAPPEQVQPVIDESQRSSPYLNVFGEPQPLAGQVVFGPPPAR